MANKKKEKVIDSKKYLLLHFRLPEDLHDKYNAYRKSQGDKFTAKFVDEVVISLGMREFEKVYGDKKYDSEGKPF